MRLEGGFDGLPGVYNLEPNKRLHARSRSGGDEVAVMVYLAQLYVIWR